MITNKCHLLLKLSRNSCPTPTKWNTLRLASIPFSTDRSQSRSKNHHQIKDSTKESVKNQTLFCGIPIGTAFPSSKQLRKFSVPPFRNNSMAVMVEKAPTGLQPYLKLMRIDKPIGSVIQGMTDSQSPFKIQ